MTALTWISASACAGFDHLFLSPALFDGEEFLADAADAPDDPRGSGDQRAARVASATAVQQEAVATAKEICGGCPVKEQCLSWGMSAEPYGVWGGMTENERAAEHKRLGTQVQVFDAGALMGAEIHIKDAPRGPRNQVDDSIVEEYTGKGMRTEEIAKHLGCAPRTITRRRATMARAEQRAGATAAQTGTGRKPSAPRRAKTPNANGPMSLAQISPATAAMFDLLSDGAVHPVEEVLAAVIAKIPYEEAAAEGKRNRPTAAPEVSLASGARARAQNRLYIARRDGHVQRDDSNRYRMSPAELVQWRAHRAGTGANVTQISGPAERSESALVRDLALATA